VGKKDYNTLPAKASACGKPDFIWEREPPIRVRKSIPTSWVKLILREGKNRQVRKMTAAVGFPTLRLVRFSIEELSLAHLEPGEMKECDESEFKKMLHL
jgi:23S rRNA pseudouridine2457 synthase